MGLYFFLEGQHADCGHLFRLANRYTLNAYKDKLGSSVHCFLLMHHALFIHCSIISKAVQWYKRQK